MLIFSYAKEHKLRLWRNYVLNATTTNRTSSTSTVIEIGLGDSLTVRKDNGDEQKVYLSSIRPPRREGGGGGEGASGRQFRPLYDIPHMFTARELLRQRVIGRKV